MVLQILARSRNFRSVSLEVFFLGDFASGVSVSKFEILVSQSCKVSNSPFYTPSFALFLFSIPRLAFFMSEIIVILMLILILIRRKLVV